MFSPNPFNPTTTIQCQMPEAGKVKLVVYDFTGREVTTLVNEMIPAGKYQVEFNVVDLSSSIYFFHIQVGSFPYTKKLVVLK